MLPEMIGLTVPLIFVMGQWRFFPLWKKFNSTWSKLQPWRKKEELKKDIVLAH